MAGIPIALDSSMSYDLVEASSSILLDVRRLVIEPVASPLDDQP